MLETKQFYFSDETIDRFIEVSDDLCGEIERFRLGAKNERIGAGVHRDGNWVRKRFPSRAIRLSWTGRTGRELFALSKNGHERLRHCRCVRVLQRNNFYFD